MIEVSQEIFAITLGVLFASIVIHIILIIIYKMDQKSRTENVRKGCIDRKTDEKMTGRILSSSVTGVGITDSSMTLMFEDNISLIIYEHQWWISEGVRELA